MPALSSDDAIERLALAVIDRSLPKCQWTHEGHFAAVLWMARHRPAMTAPDAMRLVITRYNEATDTANTDNGGYHHTITLASTRAAVAMLAARPANVPLHVVLRAVMDSPLGRSDWLLAHWRRETLFGVPARRGWIEPDLVPLPF